MRCSLRVSDLSLYALIFVVKLVIVTASRILRYEAFHLVLVEIHIAGVGVCVFVVNVKLTALTATDLALSVFTEIHISPRFY